METLQQTSGAEAIHLIIEPTGGYEGPLVSEAYRRQWRVTLVNPLTVCHWQQGRGKRGKADRLDTQMLTLFGADQKPPPNSLVCCGAKTIANCSCVPFRCSTTSTMRSVFRALNAVGESRSTSLP